MKDTTTQQRIIDYLNALTGRKYRHIKSNINKVTPLLKDFTEQEIKEVIQVKVLEWKNNPKMSHHLNPTTLFRDSNFENYINQVIAVKNDPERFKKYYQELNKETPSLSSASAKVDRMFDT